jgi:PKD repeat protein
MKQKFLFFSAGIVIIIFSACQKNLPTASFTHSSDSYEEGDTINFTSTSSDADNFEWNFGDGSTSTVENPWHIFNSTGSFDIKLKVTNDDGSDETSSSVTIKDATILAFEVIKTGTEETVPACGILVFDNETDFMNIENPIAVGYTDNDGYIEFYHAKAIVYYLYAFKEGTGGSWIFGGNTNTIVLNQLNLYTVPVEWYPEGKKSADLKTSLSNLLKK